jgi:hypothetical protein
LPTSELEDDSKKINNYSTALVKPEEVIIVALVLLIWIGVILLFIRKWGKIRGLEPYTPNFDRNNSTSTMLPSTSSQLGIPETTVPVFARCHRSNSKDTLKSFHDNRHRIKQKHHQSSVFQFPPSVTPTSSRMVKPKITVDQTSHNLNNTYSKNSRGSTKSEPDVRFTTVKVNHSSGHQNHRKSIFQLHKPPHLRKHLEFTESDFSLNQIER